MHFTEFAAITVLSGVSLYNYNLDDKRFWTSKVWLKYFSEEE